MYNKIIQHSKVSNNSKHPLNKKAIRQLPDGFFIILWDYQYQADLSTLIVSTETALVLLITKRY